MFISVLDAFQEIMRYVFNLRLLFHADNDAKGFRSSISSAAKHGQNRHGHPAQHQDAALNSSMLREKIMKTVSLSSTQPVASDFCSQKRLIPHVDKIFNPKLGAVSSCAAC